MATLTEWIYRMVIYYFGLSLIITLFSFAGAFDDGAMTAQTNYGEFSGTSTLNQTEDLNIYEGTTSTLGNLVSDVFSFFVFNISIHGDSLIVQYLWVVRFFLVWIPGIFTAVLIAMYLRGVQ